LDWQIGRNAAPGGNARTGIMILQTTGSRKRERSNLNLSNRNLLKKIELHRAVIIGSSAYADDDTKGCLRRHREGGLAGGILGHHIRPMLDGLPRLPDRFRKGLFFVALAPLPTVVEFYEVTQCAAGAKQLPLGVFALHFGGQHLGHRRQYGWKS
jgi:hypothetical protein